MFWMLTAFAANDYDIQYIEEAEADVEAVDTLIRSAFAWYLSEPREASIGLSNKSKMQAGAQKARKQRRRLIGMKGYLEIGNKADKLLAERCEKLLERMNAQNTPRYSAISLTDAGLALDELTGKPDDLQKWSQLNNALVAAVRERPDTVKTPVESWLSHPLALALKNERWEVGLGWATYCNVHCEDKATSDAILTHVKKEELPLKPDTRWVELTEKK